MLRHDPRGWLSGALVAAVVLACAGPAWCDLLVVQGGLEYKDCKIIGVEGPNILFTPSRASSPAQKLLADVQRIKIDGQADLNSAEDAYATGAWSKAIPGYQATIRSSNTPQKKWLKLFCAARLRDASDKAGDLDGAIQAWIVLVQENPTAAKGMRFTMPPANSPFLPKAIANVTTALGAAGGDKEQQMMLLNVLVQLNLAKGDQKAADDAMDKLLAIDPNNPAAKAAQIKKKVAALRDLVTAKNYDQAMQAIEKDKDSFVDEADQAEVLYLRAECLAGKADLNNKDVCRDAALEYLRVAAAFKPDVPAVADALLKAAELLEKPAVADTDGAVKLYQRIVADYRDKPQGLKAAERLRALGKGG